METPNKIILFDGREVSHGDTIKLPIDLIVPNMYNPNEMSEEAFSFLEENVEQVGFVDPIVVTPDSDGNFVIIDGQHRWEQQRMSGVKDIPCVIVSNEIFDEKTLMLQTVRLNNIRGTLNPDKFNSLIDKLVNKHGMNFDTLVDDLAFEDVDYFNQLVKAGREEIPKEARKEYDKAVKKVNSIDGLAKLIERLWLKYSCFAPQTLVSTDKGMKRICEIEKGDLVFTHLGRLRKVTNVFSRDYSGPFLKIKVQKLGDPILCTPGHEFFQVKGSYKQIKPASFGPSKFNFEKAKIIKTKASDLWYDDWLIVSKNTGEATYPDDAPTPLTEEFAWFLGLYTAEGYTNRLERQEDYFCLSLGSHETEYINRAFSFAKEFLVGDKISDKNPTIAINKNARVIRVRNEKVAAWLEREIGRGASEKHVPYWMFSQPNNIIKAYIEGAVSGDGSISDKGLVTYYTVSDVLAFQIRDLVAKLEIAGSFVSKTNNGFSEGKKHQIKVISWSNRTKYIQSGFMNDFMSGFTVKINSIEEIQYTGKIYNLEVDEDHTYQVYGIPVGNSTVPSNFMIIDYGNMRHLWIQMDQAHMATCTDLFRSIFEEGYKVSSVIQTMLDELNLSEFIETHKDTLEKISEGEETLEDLIDP